MGSMDAEPAVPSLPTCITEAGEGWAWRETECTQERAQPPAAWPPSPPKQHHLQAGKGGCPFLQEVPGMTEGLDFTELQERVSTSFWQNKKKKR